jgi:hypothetical protein
MFSKFSNAFKMRNRFLKKNWTAEQWRDHLLLDARSQRDRDEIIAIFERHERETVNS